MIVRSCAAFLLLFVNLSHSARLAGLRVNRALRATHSRRECNRLIEQGRLRVNGVIVTSPDARLLTGDQVEFDGQAVAWEESDLLPHRHIKFNKPRGVVCTTDPREPNNIIQALPESLDLTRRIYPIGRLDAESTGLILLTSNGDIVNPLLRKRGGKRKEYIVETSPCASDDDIAQLREGVIITTLAQRNGVTQEVTAPTAACVVERMEEQRLRFVLEEGRNRQIRRMCATLGLEVTSLHRVTFAGVSLDGIDAAGDWAELTEAEELAISARVPPTRNELRSEEEKARRKAKKVKKREASRERREAQLGDADERRAADAIAKRGKRKTVSQQKGVSKTRSRRPRMCVTQAHGIIRA